MSLCTRTQVNQGVYETPEEPLKGHYEPPQVRGAADKLGTGSVYANVSSESTDKQIP